MRHGLAIFLLCLTTSLRCLASVVSGDDFNANTETATVVLQQWYNSSGLYNSTGWWNAANCIEAVENDIFANNDLKYLSVLTNTYNLNDSDDFEDSYYDDEGWWCNAWIRAYDLTGDTTFLSMAKTIYTNILTGWDDSATNCGGGIWWDKTHTYKNAIPNELFLLASIRLHQRTPDDGAGAGSFFYWATNEYTWFQDSGMINSKDLVNDGLKAYPSCANNGETTWTYNQGVILGGLTDLYKVTGNINYLNEAMLIANAATATLVDGNGVLVEPCEAGDSCGDDGPQFKGIFVRYLAYLYDETNVPAYHTFLYNNAHAVWFNDRNSTNQLGLHWDGPFDTNDAARQSSALMPVSALAEPVTALLPFARGSGDPSFNHACGTAAGTLAWQCASNTSAGLMQYGPYLASLSAGSHMAHVRMAVNSLSNSASSLVSLMVIEDGVAELVNTNVPWNWFISAGVPQDFPLAFTNTSSNALEFRVFWNAVSGAPALTLSDITVDGAHNWVAANLSHNIGRLDGLNAWEADPIRDTASGYLATGPGTAELGPGCYDAQFELKVDNFIFTNPVVATLSVVDADTGVTVASRNVAQSEFPNVMYRPFNLYFQAAAGAHYNFCAYWYYATNSPRLTERSVVLTGVTAPGFSPIALTPGSYNEDMVIEAGAPGVPTGGYTSASMDEGTGNTGNGWYQAGYDAAAPATGLPAPGSTLTNQAASDHVFTLAPSYTANNAALVDSSHGASLAPAVSNCFSALSFLAATGNGPATVNYSVRHADGSAETGSFSVPDWFNNAPAAFDVQGRVNVTTGAFNSVNTGNPRLYAEDINLTNQTSPVTNISLSWGASNGSTSHVAVFAVSGVVVQPVPLGISFSPSGQMVLIWPAGLLLQATNVNGPWTTNVAASSPYELPPGAASQFFRVQGP